MLWKKAPLLVGHGIKLWIQNKMIMKPIKFFIINIIIIFLLISCEMTYNPNFTIFETPYGTVCKDESTYQTIFLLSVPGEELYYLTTVFKQDLNEELISIDISQDESKLYILIGKKNWEEKNTATQLFVYNLINPHENVYDYSCLVKHVLRPIIEETSKIIIDVDIQNNSIIYTERSGTQTTIEFDSL